MADWTSHFPMIQDYADGVSHKVEGVEYTFRPMRLGLALRLKKMAPQISKMVSALFDPKGADTGRVERLEQTPNGTPTLHETIIEAIRPDLAKLRGEQMQTAFTELLETVCGSDLQELMGALIIDSLRDSLFKDTAAPAPLVFMDKFPAKVIFQFLNGVWKANKDFFEPLQKVMGPLSAQAIASIQTRVSEAAQADEQESSGQDSASRIHG